ncbi:Uu.00g059640.m01.CDS01 [Anthostomella pinea]|uniref:Uu.00g059640.m01.CDS01 n=1 Tax=Anthostomella pinea TaxID=933095 RepID=A0AAI8VSX1_9PEZI|nr:Uu.00g059640.m01.CDS01 [Anthostomella pinea]
MALDEKYSQNSSPFPNALVTVHNDVAIGLGSESEITDDPYKEPGSSEDEDNTTTGGTKRGRDEDDEDDLELGNKRRKTGLGQWAYTEEEKYLEKGVRKMGR